LPVAGERPAADLSPSRQTSKSRNAARIVEAEGREKAKTAEAALAAPR